MMLISEANLRDFTTQLFVAAGVSPDESAAMAEALVLTNLRGVDSHGVQLLPHYIGQIERGEVNLGAKGHVVSESGACIVYDAENALGQVTAAICAEHASRLARAFGLGMVVARECNHFGAAFLWSRVMSSHGYIGVTMCDASMLVPPWQGREPRFGTNPICVSVPHPDGKGWLLDMATSAIAHAKLEQAKLRGEQTIPHGWSLDREGLPTTDMATALNGFLMPLGGYKGSGLGMMVEILSGVLAGGATFGTHVTGLRHKGRPMRANQTFLAIDVARFLPLDDFYARMDWLIKEVKSAQPARGYDQVLVAGEPEARAMVERTVNGIPIPDGVWATIAETAQRLGVAAPANSLRP